MNPLSAFRGTGAAVLGRTGLAFAIAVAISVSPGCDGQKRIILVTNTTSGFKLTPMEGEQQKLKIGIERLEVAFVPIKQKTEGAMHREAHSVYCGFYYKNKAWPLSDNGLRIVQTFGTGAAANKLAERKGVALERAMRFSISGIDRQGEVEYDKELGKAMSEAVGHTLQADNRRALQEGKSIWPVDTIEELRETLRAAKKVDLPKLRRFNEAMARPLEVSP